MAFKDFMDNTRKVLIDFGQYVKENSKKRLIRKSKFKEHRTEKGSLYNAIDKYKVEENVKTYANSISVKFPFMKDFDYAKYLDLGVKGKSKSYGNTSKSPFKFGSGKGKKGGLTKGIENWVKKKRFQFRDEETGKFLSYSSTSFLITRSVYQKGIPAKHFFSRSFDEGFKNLDKEIKEAFALDIKEAFKKYTTS